MRRKLVCGSNENVFVSNKLIIQNERSLETIQSTHIPGVSFSESCQTDNDRRFSVYEWHSVRARTLIRVYQCTSNTCEAIHNFIWQSIASKAFNLYQYFLDGCGTVETLKTDHYRHFFLEGVYRQPISFDDCAQAILSPHKIGKHQNMFVAKINYLVEY